MHDLTIVVITGMSGSGKSTALRAMEDIGFFCVDNMPVVLLPRFLKIQTETAGEGLKVALVMDLREKTFLARYPRIFAKLQDQGYRLEILFLEASDDALVRRFSETRRAHPLSPQGTVMEGIQRERIQLSPLKEMATRVIDTSAFNVHQLKDAVQRSFLSGGMKHRMTVHVSSFGYRYGLPADADLVLDVRFLPNPYFVDGLGHLNGHHPSIRDYVLQSDASREFFAHLFSLLAFLLPAYAREGKARLNIAVGCTGGRHRSVVVANRLGEFFTEASYYLTVYHRDIHKA